MKFFEKFFKKTHKNKNFGTVNIILIGCPFSVPEPSGNRFPASIYAIFSFV